MNRKSLICLLVINALLLGGLMLMNAQPTAHAQNAAKPGDYVMVAGKIQGRQGNIVYITDVANQVLLSVTYQHGRPGQAKLIPVAARDVAPDLAVKGTR